MRDVFIKHKKYYRSLPAQSLVKFVIKHLHIKIPVQCDMRGSHAEGDDDCPTVTGKLTIY
jgi:hypothetical protein